MDAKSTDSASHFHLIILSVDYSLQHFPRFISILESKEWSSLIGRNLSKVVTECLKSQSPNLYKSASVIHGIGVFTSISYETGDIIGRINGEYVHDAQVLEMGNDPLPNVIGLAPNLWINPTPPFDAINHSCVPNAVISAKRFVKALRSIQIGQEVTIDYSSTECDPNWTMVCTCQSPNCRKALLPIQFAFVCEPLAPPAMVRFWRRFRKFAIQASVRIGHQ